MGHLDPENTIITLDSRKVGSFNAPDPEEIVHEDTIFKFIFPYPSLGRVQKANECILNSQGKLIRTKSRLIFIETPHSYVRNKPSDPQNKMRDAEMREFFEFPIAEIIGYVPGKLSKGVILYVKTQTTSEQGRERTQFFQLSVKPPYEILDHPEILNKELTRKDLKALKRQEKENRL